MKCPEHGLERFQIKVVKKFNVRPDVITPKFRNRPTVGDLQCLVVGKDVQYHEMRNYLKDYFRQKGWNEAILRIRLKV